MFLSDLQPKQKARILDLMLISELVRRRLLDLGVLEGTEIRVTRLLPFRGPITLESSGQSIGLRRSDARMIRVEPL